MEVSEVTGNTEASTISSQQNLFGSSKCITDYEPSVKKQMV